LFTDPTHLLKDQVAVVIELTALWRGRLSVNNILNISVSHSNLVFPSFLELKGIVYLKSKLLSSFTHPHM